MHTTCKTPYPHVSLKSVHNTQTSSRKQKQNLKLFCDTTALEVNTHQCQFLGEQETWQNWHQWAKMTEANAHRYKFFCGACASLCCRELAKAPPASNAFWLKMKHNAMLSFLLKLKQSCSRGSLRYGHRLIVRNYLNVFGLRRQQNLFLNLIFLNYKAPVIFGYVINVVDCHFNLPREDAHWDFKKSKRTHVTHSVGRWQCLVCFFVCLFSCLSNTGLI